MSARDEILARIGAALGDVPQGERPEDVPVPRGYRTRGDEPHGEAVERFAERVAEYRAAVTQVPANGLRAAIEELCRTHGVRALAVSADVPDAWLPDGPEILRDLPERPLTSEQLDHCDGVLTGCALGIAQTGTIVLDGGPAQGRRALSLLPDLHLCVVREEQIVDLVPEAIAHLAAAVREAGRPLTLVSGPSATSDIELNRVEGVHGPRTLEVLLVDSPTSGTH